MTSKADDPTVRTKLHNVREEIRGKVSKDQLAAELSAALDGLFEITRYERFRAFGGNFVGMYAKPTKTIQSSLAIDREVFVLIANYPSLHARTIQICQEQIRREQPRLQPNLAVILHADQDGDDNLRAWGLESGITVLPIFRGRAGAMPPAALVR
jgi:hypothetical protein